MTSGATVKRAWAELSAPLPCGARGLSTRAKLVGRGNRVQAQAHVLSKQNHLWELFSVFFSVFFFFFFFDQWKICPNWHLYYGRNRPGRREGLGGCEHCVQGGGPRLCTMPDCAGTGMSVPRLCLPTR